MIYLDHHAATPPSAAALAAMASAREHGWANPSSVHAAGRRARALLEGARRDLATALAVDAREVVFTSGGTEAAQLAVWGATQGPAAHLVTTSFEHPAVSAAVDAAERRGWKVTRLGAASGMPPSADALAAAVTIDTRALVVQAVNHETGTIFPVADYARVVAGRPITLAVDGAQAFGKAPLDLGAWGTAFVAVSSQKIGGPAGIGATIVARGIDFEPVISGGAQERGRRSGTPNTVLAVGFAEAARGVPSRLSSMDRVALLRDRLETGLLALGGEANGSGAPRVATVTNVSFRGLRSELLVAAMDLEGVCMSAGAACSSGVTLGSAVLRAMAPDEPWRAAGATRWSLSADTTDADVDEALRAAKAVISRVKAVEHQ